MPPKKKNKTPVDKLADVTFDTAFSAFHLVAGEMEKNRYQDGSDTSARFIPSGLMRAAAKTSDAKGGSHTLQVRGVTDSNVKAMKSAIGHSGSLSSSNFLVREELELVSAEGTLRFFLPQLTQHSHRARSCKQQVWRKVCHQGWRFPLRDPLHCKQTWFLE